MAPFTHWLDLSNEVYNVSEFPLVPNWPVLTDIFFNCSTLTAGHFGTSGSSETLCTSFERSNLCVFGATKLKGVPPLLSLAKNSWRKAIVHLKRANIPFLLSICVIHRFWGIFKTPCHHCAIDECIFRHEWLSSKFHRSRWQRLYFFFFFSKSQWLKIKIFYWNKFLFGIL